MQEHDRSIFEADPPFLVLFANQQWKVAIEVIPHAQGIAIIEPFSENTPDSAVIIPGSPWHVGDNVWEFDYATQVMTLNHPNYRKHPAWQLWLYWLQQQGVEHNPALH
jgi:hypothetical protein